VTGLGVPEIYLEDAAEAARTCTYYLSSRCEGQPSGAQDSSFSTGMGSTGSILCPITPVRGDRRPERSPLRPKRSTWPWSRPPPTAPGVARRSTPLDAGHRVPSVRGRPQAQPLLMQIYADVAAPPVSSPASYRPPPAVGLGDPCRGRRRAATPDLAAASAVWAGSSGRSISADPDRAGVYDDLFAEYRTCTTTSAGRPEWRATTCCTAFRNRRNGVHRRMSALPPSSGALEQVSALHA